ncbi:hypothetical protein ACNAW0_13810 [Micromonospora sp. SL1-18]|uniref:hypothetical protein n=1 Tax=Micromonospora sp. SL1-18 TaxID=3399128 RepID=UPI003A4E4210
MSTDRARAARQPAGCPDDPRSNLLALVQRRSQAIIDAELHRLARRAPSLSPADLDDINTVLEELAELAILAPLRNAPRDTALPLTRIFDAGMNADEMKTEIDRSRRVVTISRRRV